MQNNKNSADGCIDWEMMAKAMAEGKKMAEAIERNMVWSKIDVSGGPEKVSEETNGEDSVMNNSNNNNGDDDEMINSEDEEFENEEESNEDDDVMINTEDDGDDDEMIISEDEEFEDEEESAEDSWRRMFYGQQDISSDESDNE